MPERIAMLYESYDPYGFSDAFCDFEEAAACYEEALREDPQELFSWILGILPEIPESMAAEAGSILHGLRILLEKC